MQQQQRHRLADDVAAADDDGARAGDGHAILLEQLDHAGRRAGDQPLAVLHETPDVLRREAIDVLGRVDGLEDAPRGVAAHR